MKRIRNSAHSGATGFSLVELLISIIIISIGIVGFATAVGLMATELWFGLRDTELSMLVVSEEAFGAEGAAPNVASEVAQGSVAAPDGFELNVPPFGGAQDVSLGGGEIVVELGV